MVIVALFRAVLVMSFIGAVSLNIAVAREIPSSASVVNSEAQVLGSWLDTVLSEAIDQRRASAIAVVMVEDGEEILRRGYGFADVDEQNPVDPGRSLFSIGSISKNFTATAVMQLLENGQIESLDDPVNRYLRRYQLRDVGGRVVNIRDLLTHRGGFADSFYGLATLREYDLPISAAEIAQRMPEQVRAAGETVVYSNAGYGLLGIMVEDISGETLPAYFERHIFTPLDMQDSFVRTSPEIPALYVDPQNNLPDGHSESIPQNWAYHPFIASSAAIVATADDLARFAQAHLQAESANVPDLVSSHSARLMHSRLVSNHEAVSGFGLSFVIHERQGVRVFENAGSGPGFQALMITVPDRQIVVIVLIAGSRSAAEEGEAAGLHMFEIRDAFLRRAIGDVVDSDNNASAEIELSGFAGVYRNQRRPYGTVESLINPGSFIEVVVGAHDTLTINGETGYREVAPGVFWKAGIPALVTSVGSSGLYAFLSSAEGQIIGVTPELSIDVFQRTSRSVSDVLIWAALFGFLALTGLGAKVWKSKRSTVRAAGWFGVGLGLAILGLIIAIAWPILTGANLIMDLAMTKVTTFIILIVIANIAALMVFGLTIVMAYELNAKLAGRSEQGWASLTHWTIVWLGGVGLMFVLAWFSLIGINLP